MIRLCLRAFAIFSLLLLTALFSLLPLKWSVSSFWRLICYLGRKALGIKKVTVIGTPYEGICLMACNHSSYADILLLRSISGCHFVSKDDVARWPIIGWIARRARTTFISRKSSNVKLELEKIHQGTKDKKVLFFPEGTTSDGCRVLPFKTSYFELSPETVLQPISLRYTQVNGLPASRFFEKLFSWRGEENLVSHLRYVLKIRCVSATMIFHPPIYTKGDRKQLAKETFDYVQKGFEDAMAKAT